MRQRLFILVLLSALWPALLASAATVVGVVVNGSTGSPLSGAYVSVGADGTRVTTNFNGQFRLETADNTDAYIVVSCDGYQSAGIETAIGAGTVNVGEIRLTQDNIGEDFYGDAADLIFDEAVLDDDEGSAQSISALTGANDNIYYNTASYNFGPMYFRYRGYDSQYQSVYINGIK